MGVAGFCETMLPRKGAIAGRVTQSDPVVLTGGQKAGQGGLLWGNLRLEKTSCLGKCQMIETCLLILIIDFSKVATFCSAVLWNKGANESDMQAGTSNVKKHQFFTCCAVFQFMRSDETL